jgi:hypothetical protein
MAGTPTPFEQEVYGAIRDERIHTDPTLGSYIGNSPPPTPDQMRDYFNIIASSYPPNTWPLSDDFQATIDNGVNVYAVFVYNKWLTAPMNVSANDAVKQWYTSEKARLGL